MEKWYVAAKKADFDKWAAEFQISPVLARILRNRDLTEEAQVRKFLQGTLKDCYSPWLMKDMEKAVELITQAVEQGVSIRVIGDYDVDGICSTYILTKGLQLLGAKADAAIPHRIHDGYGLNDSLIEEAKQDGVGMIVTCDNGIAAAAQIELANTYGIRVIVTDHHEVPFQEEQDEAGNIVKRELLPPAMAVIDPKQAQCAYPFPGICGGVVAYKLMQAIGERTKHPGLEEVMEEFLEFAALSTVCDVMELKDENRILVKEGLKRLRATRNQGLRALMEVNQLEPAGINVYHLGFVIGPCLNATGRLDTARRALELLQSRTEQEAFGLAGELKEMNDSRKNLTLKGVEEAEQFIRENCLEQDKVMVIFLPSVHESLAGIVAGRIRERYNHPVFILTEGEEGVKGSGRSIEGYHMYNAMVQVKKYFSKFGGHAMAAGLSMISELPAVGDEKIIEGFRREINEKCDLKEEDFAARVHIDVPMPMDYGTEELAEELNLLEPFGVGNPKPLFAEKDLVFLAGFKMGAKKNCARYTVQTLGGSRKQLVYFGDLERFGRFLEEKYGAGSEEALYAGQARLKVSVVYQLGTNTYKGKKELQYVMQYYC
ncbi:MAG: single-stranded-DNA-specific exonuclease RecJ [Butyrivibrio sp.]|nr:single-stranded-DNA-specific exonuclease RecJ [Acetatifactor muris]MCM1560411.1 single-stranded-DNA-specific exonuclease RecJ [Butyrivibrio sp.]